MIAFQVGIVEVRVSSRIDVRLRHKSLQAIKLGIWWWRRKAQLGDRNSSYEDGQGGEEKGSKHG